MTRPLSVLVMSTPVGALGSGAVGGVEVTLRGIAAGLTARGHHVEVVAPRGSLPIGVPLHPVDGSEQMSMQFVERSSVVDTPTNSFLVNMWRVVEERHAVFDVVLNLAYDDLPFRRAADLSRPVAHLVS
ncbi:MAG: UDP-glucose--tetrahydrobiopterin glucosyltransferase, partial [Actinomycetota bacterium]